MNPLVEILILLTLTTLTTAFSLSICARLGDRAMDAHFKLLADNREPSAKQNQPPAK